MEEVYTYLLDACDREWQHVGHKKQFEYVKKHLFSTFIKLFHQVDLEMVEIISFFSWHTRDSVGKQRRMLNQLRLASIIPLLTNQKMIVDALLGNNEESLRKKVKKKHGKP